MNRSLACSIFRIVPIFLLLGWLSPCFAQDTDGISLTQAYKAVAETYPLTKNRDLYDSLLQVQNRGVNRQRLPQLNLLGEGAYQSETLKAPASVPFPLNVPRYSYRAYGELEWTLYEGGKLNTEIRKNERENDVSQKQLAVDLYSLKDRVNTLFFSILLARAQESMLQTSLADIQSQIQTVQARFEHGAALESELSKLKVRKLELEADFQDLEGTISAQSGVLRELSGLQVDADTPLFLPVIGDLNFRDSVLRPEVALYEARASELETDKAMVRATKLPRISAFAQGGYSDPNRFNLFDTEGKEFAMGGVRLRWNLFDWGVAKSKRSELDIRETTLEHQKETFVHNIATRQSEFERNSKKIREKIQKDTEIAALQKDILEQYAAQLEHGVINVTDYLIQLNAELRARLQLEIDKIEWQRLQVNYLTLFGKL